ncbi:DegT/DnrJ/EryC1/StrS aminotransferase family protein [Thauera sp. CAU 1555]|uniref:DegT/DnrJ/EryC1/StrS aminotransferase family protein n=1 Tax=Thauera sedimentorum TaxID=2767595 RepID=A0ABR9BEZ5_9RHOO|nr:DegT/DnrJ/EryC1/StrS family aminotransferase [Thauera sedimentorum]MBC9073659.1 DegT/DnrJ/EryC1/StrS aminotransferase family protein [Thauera sedimentorum]MBD8504578.1 DegT/DnrJ/EryC1/StrS aminotransferase family protein [Thauera sedimentorum]
MTALPRRPILDWPSFVGTRSAGMPSVADLPHKRMTTSGRAAIFQALRLAGLAPGTPVLVPTYHCPTMVAPAVLAGLRPVFYALDGNGLPVLDTIPAGLAREAGAILVPHLFGIVRSLAEVRQWCDRTDTLLIEDCAHAYYGMAGERPVGHWGDYATASLSKFLPVPEGGLLASAHRPVPPLGLHAQSPVAQLKGLFDVLHFATDHGCLKGLRTLVGTTVRWRRHASAAASSTLPRSVGQTGTSTSTEADMSRHAAAPLAVTRALHGVLPRRQIVDARRANYLALAAGLDSGACARPLFPSLGAGAAPYAFPYWVSDADRVYAELRDAGAPVFRWDRIWPGTPVIPGDSAPDWHEHLIQVLCHQALRPDDITWTIATIRRIVNASADACHS